eukprot:PhM_4_TR13677/c5_g1_i8/m.19430
MFSKYLHPSVIERSASVSSLSSTPENPKNNSIIKRNDHQQHQTTTGSPSSSSSSSRHSEEKAERRCYARVLDLSEVNNNNNSDISNAAPSLSVEATATELPRRSTIPPVLLLPTAPQRSPVRLREDASLELASPGVTPHASNALGTNTATALYDDSDGQAAASSGSPSREHLVSDSLTTLDGSSPQAAQQLPVPPAGLVSPSALFAVSTVQAPHNDRLAFVPLSPLNLSMAESYSHPNTQPPTHGHGQSTPRQRPSALSHSFTAMSTRARHGSSPSPLMANSRPMLSPFSAHAPNPSARDAASATAPITPQVSSMCDAQWALVAALDNVVHTGRLAMVALAACGAVAALRELGVPPPAVCAAKLGVCAWFVHEARSSAPASITTTTATGSSTSASMMGQTCSSPQQQQLSLSSSYNNNNNNN